ncbi:MAG: hypothetical protein HY010_09620 [Acidobacteria bacterium]|nr:hypothetical protein [Acidobacteriota bacterium]
MTDDLDKAYREIAKFASQYKVAGFTATELARFQTLETGRFSELFKLAELQTPAYNRTMQELTANLEHLYPLKSIQAALASIELPQPPMSAILQAHLAEITGIGASFAETIGERTRLLFDAAPMQRYQEIFAHISQEISRTERSSLELSKLALTWPSEIVGDRLVLLEDSLSNVAALRELETNAALSSMPLRGIERVEVATDLVWNHGNFVRRLPPALPDVPKWEPHRDEELTTKLETKLLAIDPRLLELRREAWRNLASGKAGARLAAHGVREILGELLRLFAPDEKVKQSGVWLERKDQALSKPTRRMRLEYIVGDAAADLAALFQFDESVQNANKFAHVFEDNVEVVRAHLAQVEACIYLVITYAIEDGE